MKRLLLLVGLAVLVGCSKGTPGDVVPADTPAIIKVDNQRFQDMTIYVVENGVRDRLGLARGNFTTSFTIPVRYSQRAAILRFVADPIGGAALPVTQDITVEPGDEVLMRITP